MTKDALPTAAELLEAAEEGRLKDVVLPNGQKLGEYRTPRGRPLLENHRQLAGRLLLDHPTPLGKRQGDLIRDDLVQLIEFYKSVADALETHRQKSGS